MYKTGYVSTAYALVKEIREVAIAAGWKLLASTNPSADECSYAVLEGNGDGNDKIYAMFKVYHPSDDKVRIQLDGLGGYDEYLEWYEQPASIQQALQAEKTTQVDIPVLSTTHNELMYYWIFVSSYRIICVIRQSIQYHSLYLGLIEPIASERQYPYPMYVAGNSSNLGNSWLTSESGSFVYPYKNSGYLRRADGVWRSFDSEKLEPNPYSKGTVFPYNTHNKQLIPNYKGKSDSSIVQDNFLLIPIILETTDPIDMCGILRGCYWVSGTRDLAAEQTFECMGQTYICFDTMQHRDSNSYFCVTME